MDRSRRIPSSDVDDLQSTITGNARLYGVVDRFAVMGITGRIKRKERGWEHLFELEGERWEDQSEDLKAMHVTIPGNRAGCGRHIVVYAYALAAEFNVIEYLEGGYTSEDREQWLGPMEAMCLLLEAVKERDAMSPSPG